MNDSPQDGRTALVVGAGGLGGPVAARLVERGERVFVTSREQERATAIAADLGPDVTGLALDLARPDTIEAALEAIDSVDHVVLTGIPQFPNTLADFDADEAVKAVTVKLVGYPKVVHVLRERMTDGAAVVFFGGMAKERPYPGSTMVTTFNQGVSGLVRTLAVELAPHRVNAIHPGLVGDSPRWAGVDHPLAGRAPLGRLVTTDEIVGAVEFLLDNTGVTGHDLVVDGALSIV